MVVINSSILHPYQPFRRNINRRIAFVPFEPGQLTAVLVDIQMLYVSLFAQLLADLLLSKPVIEKFLAEGNMVVLTQIRFYA